MHKQKVIQWLKQNRFNYGDARKILETARRNFNLSDADVFELKNVAQELYAGRDDPLYTYCGTSWQTFDKNIKKGTIHKSRNKTKRSEHYLSDEY